MAKKAFFPVIPMMVKTIPRTRKASVFFMCLCVCTSVSWPGGPLNQFEKNLSRPCDKQRRQRHQQGNQDPLERVLIVESLERNAVVVQRLSLRARSEPCHKRCRRRDRWWCRSPVVEFEKAFGWTDSTIAA